MQTDEPTIEAINEGFSTNEMKDHTRDVDLGAQIQEPTLGEVRILHSEIQHLELQDAQFSFDYEIRKRGLIQQIYEKRKAITTLLSQQKKLKGIPEDWGYDAETEKFVPRVMVAPNVSQ